MGYDAAWLARQLQKPNYSLAIGSMGVALNGHGQPVGWTPAPRRPGDAESEASALAYARLLISGEPVLALILPYPPSVNHYYHRLPDRVVITQAGRDYRQAVGVAVAQQCPAHPPLTGRLAILIELHAPDRRTRDTDNPEKALLDALTHAGVYEDDGQIDDKRTLRCPRHQPPYVRVTLATCEKGLSYE